MSVKWFLIGIVFTHAFWIGVAAAWWYKLTRGDKGMLEATREDFQAVRESIRRRLKATRN